jgi:hypothetical protein
MSMPIKLRNSSGKHTYVAATSLAYTWLLKSIKINTSRWNQETPLAAQETPEFHQEGNFPCHSPAVKDTPWIAVSDGTCHVPFLPSVSTRQRFLGLHLLFSIINEFSIFFRKILPKQYKNVSKKGRSVPIQSFVFL